MVAPPAWHGTHSLIQKHFYNPTNYMKLRLKRIGKSVPAWAMRKIGVVFPVIYDAFRRVCTDRKNMICYGFVIGKLLDMMGVDQSRARIKKVTTPAKVKENERQWKRIMDNCVIYMR